MILAHECSVCIKPAPSRFTHSLGIVSFDHQKTFDFVKFMHKREFALKDSQRNELFRVVFFKADPAEEDNCSISLYQILYNWDEKNNEHLSRKQFLDAIIDQCLSIKVITSPFGYFETLDFSYQNGDQPPGLKVSSDLGIDITPPIGRAAQVFILLCFLSDACLKIK